MNPDYSSLSLSSTTESYIYTSEFIASMRLSVLLTIVTFRNYKPVESIEMT